eukprot:888941-Amphidinium_carterae.1
MSSITLAWYIRKRWIGKETMTDREIKIDERDNESEKEPEVRENTSVNHYSPRGSETANAVEVTTILESS